VIDRAGGGEAGVQLRAARRVQLGHPDRDADALRRLAANARPVASPMPALAPMITTRWLWNDMVRSSGLSRLQVSASLYQYWQSRQIDRLPA
jgi:hypothetical protein